MMELINLLWELKDPTPSLSLQDLESGYNGSLLASSNPSFHSRTNLNRNLLQLQRQSWVGDLYVLEEEDPDNEADQEEESKPRQSELELYFLTL